mmetsp:Transcript_2987/g.8734  ORF Transcript_2987/g.8734 Transcript_2987/m.8734 type:complete len:551 (-) Transcript_2987:70-1722(-)
MTKVFVALALAVAPAGSFKSFSNFKLPSLVDAQRQMAAKAKFGTKKLAVVTGTSSGLGRKTARALLRTGRYHVVGAVRDLDKMDVVAEIEDFDPDSFTAMECELNSFVSVRAFCEALDKWRVGKPVDRLICNAGVYQPSLPYAKWSADGIEQTMQINYLSHFLMVSLLMPDMVRAPDPRVVFVGSVTGNDNTVGGGGVYPIADLKDLEGLKAGAKNPISMFDGYNFDGAKAYKDSKLCLMMLSNLLHDRYHRQTGIAFSAIYPGCIAESPLFREKRPWFRKYFPVFMKYITGGFVGEEEAGMRLFQVAHDPRCSKSGVYWSWNGGPREGRGAEALERGGQITGGGGAGGGWDSIYENDQSDKVLDQATAADLFAFSTLVTGAHWPAAHQPRSPCPTLKVIGALTDLSNRKQELRRMRDQPGMVAGKGIVVSAAASADAAAGRALLLPMRFAQRLLLGRLPDAATSGSLQADATPRRAGGLLGPLRRRRAARPAAAPAAAEAPNDIPEDSEDPARASKERLRAELELELRAKIQARAAAAMEPTGKTAVQA